MRTLVIGGMMLALLFCGSTHSDAQRSDACKECRDHYEKCTKNYSGPTCKTERDICLKGCRKR